MDRVDPKHLGALLGTAGKNIATLPGAKDVVARLREAHSATELRRFLDSVDLGLAPPARRTITEAAGDDARWKETQAAILRSAEHQLVERFSASS